MIATPDRRQLAAQSRTFFKYPRPFGDVSFHKLHPEYGDKKKGTVY
jgi:hypothetical protein